MKEFPLYSLFSPYRESVLLWSQKSQNRSKITNLFCFHKNQDQFIFIWFGAKPNRFQTIWKNIFCSKINQFSTMHKNIAPIFEKFRQVINNTNKKSFLRPLPHMLLILSNLGHSLVILNLINHVDVNFLVIN